MELTLVRYGSLSRELSTDSSQTATETYGVGSVSQIPWG
jgi:hypothetical protein